MVKDKQSFFKERLKEMRQIKELHQSSQLLLGLPADRVVIYVGEGYPVYRFDFHNLDVEKTLLGRMYFIPQEHRLDIYSSDQPNVPMLQATGKKVVFKNYSAFLDRLGLDTLFRRFLNII